MCLDFLRPKRKPEKDENQEKFNDSGPPSHQGGPGPGVWEPRPCPPFQGYGGSNYGTQKKISEDDGKPPKFNSEPDDTIARNTRNISASAQKATSPTSSPLHYTNHQANSNSDTDEPATEKMSKFKQPPPPSPRKPKTRTRVPLEYNHQRYLTSYEVERNTIEYSTSASEEEHNTKPSKKSSNDGEKICKNSIVFPENRNRGN